MNFISKFTKKDFYFSIVTGLITGFAAWRIFEYLEVNKVGNYSFFWFLLVVPILWILGVNLGYFLGKWLNFFNQFGKFAAIGFTNAAVDFGVLNLLIANTGISTGGWYPVFKAMSFLCAIIPSYFWNKYWAFSSSQGSCQGDALTSSSGFEFAKFMSVAIVSIFINTGIASLVVNYVHPILGFNLNQWANIGAVAGSATALIFSFVGFKVAVFKK
ncbi:MAG TPA: GtrA family protein [Candidatus Paceibacterota bacterium]